MSKPKFLLDEFDKIGPSKYCAYLPPSRRRVKKNNLADAEKKTDDSIKFAERYQ